MPLRTPGGAFGLALSPSFSPNAGVRPRVLIVHQTCSPTRPDVPQPATFALVSWTGWDFQVILWTSITVNILPPGDVADSACCRPSTGPKACGRFTTPSWSRSDWLHQPADGMHASGSSRPSSSRGWFSVLPIGGVDCANATNKLAGQGDESALGS